MAVKIGIINGKGGVGKTTIATNLAGFIHLQGHRICLVDTDPQGSARDWRNVQSDNADLPTVVGLDKPTLHKDLPGIEPAFDYIIIDGASKTNLMNSCIIKSVDIAIIPIQPSVLDIWGASDTVDLIKERQLIANEIPKATFLITMDKPKTRLSKEITEAVKMIGLPIFESKISDRELYKQSIAQGLLGFNYGRKEDKNTIYKEISQLFNEIIKIFKMG